MNEDDYKRTLRGDKNLEGADLRNVNLRDADLAGANMSNANLDYADLAGANMSNANLAGVKGAPYLH
tara:strand:+ start:640 stop:840 length:201 start_codon:yes stop_codon:yes gene_type:complete